MSISDPAASLSKAAEGPAAGNSRNPNLILAFLCIAGFMTFLDVSIVNVSLPTIERELKISETTLQYIVTTYGTVLGGCLLLGGRLADSFGRLRMLRAGLIVFALASLTAGLSHIAVLLVVARGLQGLGAAFIAPSALSILANTFPEGAERTRALGVWGGLAGIASVAGVMLGGLLTEGPGWRWIFLINVPIGLAAAALAPVIVRAGRDTARRGFDLAGAVVLTAGLVLLIFALGQTASWGWGSAKSIGLLLGAAVLIFIFIMVERSADTPLIPLSTFRQKALRNANLIAICMLGSLVTLFFFASLLMQQVLNYSPIKTGLAYLPIALIVVGGAGVSQGLVKRLAAKPVLIAGLALATTGLVLLWRVPVHASYPADVLPAFLIAGLGFGMAFVPIQVIAFSGVRAQDSGMAAGLINTSQEAGGALGVAIAASIAFARIPSLTRWAGHNPARVAQARADVFHEAFIIGAGFALLGALIAVTLPTMRGGHQKARGYGRGP
jgi:EmrB/QacA subfamily drug resistance transporter